MNSQEIKFKKAQEIYQSNHQLAKYVIMHPAISAENKILFLQDLGYDLEEIVELALYCA